MTTNWIKAGVAAVALTAVPFAASAADMPVKGARPYYKAMPSAIAYYNWTGFYAGAVAGYGWGDSTWSVPAVSVRPKGWNLGGTLGYNLQTGSIVWGIETDLSWSNVKGSTTVGGATFTTENGYLGTVRGRVGYSFDRFLPYLTGGLAYGNIKAKVDPAGLSATKTKLGWTIGGGLEYAFMGNWTAKAEYLYVDLGSMDPGFAAPVATSVKFDEHLVRVGLNYKFSGPIFSRW
jgi:outer membrane immunogenic protein